MAEVASDVGSGRNAKGRENILTDEHIAHLDAIEKRIYDDMSQDQIDEYREIYNIFDADQSGSIQHDEIAQVMRTLGQNPTDDEVEQMVSAIDVDGNGEVEFDEFIILMVQQLKKENMAEEELVEVFKVFDKNGDGAIGMDDLIARFAELGDPISEDDARDMIRFCDVDDDGEFNFTEFVKVMMYDTDDKTLIDPALNKK